MEELDVPQMRREVESLQYQLAINREKSSITVTELVKWIEGCVCEDPFLNPELMRANPWVEKGNVGHALVEPEPHVTVAHGRSHGKNRTRLTYSKRKRSTNTRVSAVFSHKHEGPVTQKGLPGDTLDHLGVQLLVAATEEKLHREVSTF
ncbi:hypothetical protein INR49_032848 [Caranx melampygus]|nr:hypothetical protein INR49_032848 [Caranx melampygus]